MWRRNNVLFGNIWSRVITCVGLVLISTALAWSQSINGRIVGTVTDPSGAVVPKAELKATNQETGIAWTSLTDPHGGYTFAALPAGTYTIEVKAGGFKTAVATGKTVTVSGTARVDFPLQVGAVAEKVEVSSSSPIVETTVSGEGQLMSQHQIDSLPLNGRIFSQLVQLIPGATPGGASGEEPESLSGTGSRTPISANVNGVGANANSFTIDGVANAEPLNGYISLAPPVEAIEEFKIQTANPDAEYGNYSGARINLTIRSGTNDFHGSLFEYFRNDALNAKTYFAKAKAPYKSNQFGGTLGGPIKKNKAFFFFDYQQLALRLGQTYNLTVPDANMLNGVLTRTDGFHAEYDPQNNFQPFLDLKGQPCNLPTSTECVIPKNRWDTLNTTVLGIFPAAPNPSLSPLNGPNYITNVSNPENLYSLDIKGDYDFGAHGRMFVRESYARRNFTKTPPLGNKFLFTDPNAATQNHNAVIGYNVAFRPDVLEDLRLGYNRFDTRDFGNDFGTNQNAVLGLANAVVVGFPATSGIADFTSGTGINDLGTDGWTDAQREAQYFEITNGITWIRGGHTFKFGFDGRRIESTLTNPDQSPRGVFAYSANQTSNNGVDGDAFASYLLGFPNNVKRGFVLTRPYIWTNEGGIYGQDNWRVTPELTLNLGLRWEFLTPYVDKYNRESNFNLTTGLFDLANPQNRTPNVNTEYGDFAPRLGIAYAPNSKLVFRAAFGTSYYSQGGTLYGGTLERNFPFFQSLSLTGSNSYQPFWKVSQNNALPYGNLPYTSILPPPSSPAQPIATIAPISGVVPRYVPRNTRPTRIYMWNFGAQRELGANSSIEVAFVATDGSFLTRSYNINIPFTPSASPLVAQRSPYYSISPLTPNITFNGSDGASRYDSLQVSYTHQYSHGVQALLAYTFAHSKSDTGAGQFFFPWDDSLNWGPNSQRQVFTGSWTYDLPFGRRRAFLSGAPGFVQAIAGGWSVNGIATARSGSPLSVGAHNNTLNLGIGNRANVTCSNVKYPKTINKWFDTSCFTDPSAQTFGNAKNGTLWGPGVVNFDLSGFKSFKIESVTTEFRAEVFNAFNNPHFSSPNTSFGSGSFGKITNTTLTAREMQLGLKMLF